MLPSDSEDGKALPQTPASTTGSRTRNASVVSTTDEVPPTTRQRSDTNRSQQSIPNYARPTSAAQRQTSANSPKSSYDGPRFVTPTSGGAEQKYDRSQSSFSQRSPRRAQALDKEMLLAAPMEDEYIPQPLSPRRPMSPPRTRADSDASMRGDFAGDRNRLGPDFSGARGHQRTGSHESISWLDPIDESGGSSVSSVHSRSSSLGVRRKHIRAVSGDTEAEFDAALDDAIEAAYDDGFEPAPARPNLDYVVDEDDVIATALRKVQLAKERVRQSELEMQRLATDRDRRMRALQEEEEQTLPGGFYDGTDSDEEERILEEMTDGYAIEDFSLGAGQRPSTRLPRESDSSELTSRTWLSSTVSNPPTANTVLSTVSETAAVPFLSKSQGPIAPPPTTSLPKLPAPPPTSSPSRDNIRDRRLSGTTQVKQLKIETQKLGPKVKEPATAGPTMQNPQLPLTTQPKTAGFIVQQRQALSSGAGRAASLRRGPSPVPPGLAVDGAPPTPPVPASFQEPENRSESPAPRPPTLRKNFSSASLKNMKTRNPSVSGNLDEYSDISPGTPLSNPFSTTSAVRPPAMPSLPTPVASAFRDRMTSAAGGYHLFDADIHSPMSPTEPDVVVPDSAPASLEPCPKEVMLRPFWLMRALYQTLCHPKGGYISNKLFVPRDAWRVKGVKIKNLEDKISQCDLLTAALQKLDLVNTDDADAVLEEMQSLESVLEQVQTFLTRRLGNEVGVQGAGSLFRDADGGSKDGADGKPIPRNNSISGGKGVGTFSWKRLRGKTSSTAINNAYDRGGPNNNGRKDSVANIEPATSTTLPFTDHPTSRPSKRDVLSVQFTGPNANYMASLARLFDAAQSIGMCPLFSMQLLRPTY